MDVGAPEHMSRVALILCSGTPTGLVLQHMMELIQEG